MKKPMHPGVIAAILFLIYVVGIVGGLVVTTYMPGEWKRKSQEYYTSQRITEYVSTGRVDNWRNGGLAAVIYDKNGRFENFFRMNGDQFSINFVLQTEDRIDEVLAGKRQLFIFPFVKNLSKVGYTSFLYVGLPIRTEGEITGAFFWIRELPDLVETMAGYAIVFTLFFAITVGFLAGTLRVQRRYEEARRRYIDNITHEMKSPIASIRALTEALTDGKVGADEDEQSLYYGLIIGEANRQERMIHDALTIAKLQSGAIKPKPELIAAEDIIKPLAREQAALCELIGVNFVVTDGVRALTALYTDPALLTQVMSTLFANARKFVSEGGCITLSAETRRGRAVLCIADDGVGIPKEDLPLVFERFYKGRGGNNDTGSGLGLAIAKETCTALREKIWIESEEGKGTRVFFTVMLA